jgi:hypothetical protein
MLVYYHTRLNIIGVACGLCVSVTASEGKREPGNRLVGQTLLGVVRGSDLDVLLPAEEAVECGNDRLKFSFEGSGASILSDVIVSIEGVLSASMPPSMRSISSGPPVSLAPRSLPPVPSIPPSSEHEFLGPRAIRTALRFKK